MTSGTLHWRLLKPITLWMLLLSYHRRLRMISEAIDLRMEGERVSHSWYMGVVSHGDGGLIGGRDGGGAWHACGTKPGG